MSWLADIFFPKRAMTLFMTLVVKNEEDIIEQHIRFHCAMGVDGFIVSSHNCTDGTNSILQKLKNEGLVREILYRTTPEHQHRVWVNEMMQIAKKKYKADWIINSDADEFYYSTKLNLKESIAECHGANLLEVDSIFLFPSTNKDFLKNSYFVTRPFQAFEAKMLGINNDSRYEDFIGSQGCTKVILKIKDVLKLVDGNHDAKMRRPVRAHTAGIRLYHYHIRSYKGWEEKVARWQEAVFKMPGSMGEHMKKMVLLYQKGELPREFEAKFGDSMKEFLLQQGVVSYDPSVCNFLLYKNIIN